MVAGAAVGVPMGTYCADPARSGGDALDHLRLCFRHARFAGLGISLPGPGACVDRRSASAACPDFVAGWRRPADRRSSPTGWAGRSHRASPAPTSCCSLRRSDLFSLVSYVVAGLLTMDVLKLSLLVGPIYAFGLLIGAQMFGKASEHAVSAITCCSLIALAAVIGLPCSTACCADLFPQHACVACVLPLAGFKVDPATMEHARDRSS